MTVPHGEEELRPSRFAWRYLDAESASLLWDELIDWTTWLRERYELGTKIPPCWYRHGPVVEELTALMAAWTAVYYGDDGYREDMAAWHTQWLWPTVSRLHQITDFESCTQSACPVQSPVFTTLNGLEDFVQDDVLGRPALPGSRNSCDRSPTVHGRLIGAITPDDMQTAIDGGLAQVVANSFDDCVCYEGFRWTYDSNLGGWTKAL